MPLPLNTAFPPTSEHASNGPNIMSKQHRLLVTVKNMAEHEISYMLSGLSHGTFHLFCDRATWNICLEVEIITKTNLIAVSGRGLLATCVFPAPRPHHCLHVGPAQPLAPPLPSTPTSKTQPSIAPQSYPLPQGSSRKNYITVRTDAMKNQDLPP